MNEYNCFQIHVIGSGQTNHQIFQAREDATVNAIPNIISIVILFGWWPSWWPSSK